MRIGSWSQSTQSWKAIQSSHFNQGSSGQFNQGTSIHSRQVIKASNQGKQSINQSINQSKQTSKPAKATSKAVSKVNQPSVGSLGSRLNHKLLQLSTARGKRLIAQFKLHREDFLIAAQPLNSRTRKRQIVLIKKTSSFVHFALYIFMYVPFLLRHVFFQQDRERSIYLLERAETPGSSLPSRSSKLAPPPVET
jgi:hypothetical protein